MLKDDILSVFNFQHLEFSTHCLCSHFDFSSQFDISTNISTYRKLAWVGFEPTTTEFCSDALTHWAIRSWVQLTLRANFVQLLQFHLFVQCSCFISVFAFISRQICFKGSLAQVITLSQVISKWCHKGEILKNHFHELLYIPGYSVDSKSQEKMCFVIVRRAITVQKCFKKLTFTLTFSRKFLHYICY